MIRRLFQKLSPGERTGRGSGAERLLENEVLREALASMRHDCVQAWRQAGTIEEREQAHALMAGVDAFETRLKGYVADGMLAAKELDRARSAMTERATQHDRKEAEERRHREAAANLRRVRGEA